MRPSFTGASAVSVPENTTAAGTVTATDADVGDSVTYSIPGGSEGGVDGGLFDVDPLSGALSFKAAPDFETARDVLSTRPANAAGNNEYVVSVRAASGTGNRARSKDLTIVVTVTDDDGPTVSTVSFGSTPTAGQNDTYKLGDPIEVEVAFSDTVAVTGTPTLELTIGEGAGAARQARYSGGSTTDTLTFSYTVAAGDEDRDGAAIVANGLEQAGGSTIRDAAGTEDAVLTHDGRTGRSGHKVDGIAPTISRVVLGLDAGRARTLTDGGAIDVSLLFSEPVAVTGAPHVGLGVGDRTRTAAFNAYAAQENGASFAYTVAADDYDSDGVGVLADSLMLNGGTIRDLAGNDAALAHPARQGRADQPVVGSARAPRLSIADVRGAEDASPLAFTVSLAAVGGLDVSVDYETSNGTATAGSDYTRTSGTLTIPAGRTSGTIEVPILQDTTVEGDETFTVTLTRPADEILAITGTEATGTIKDDDGAQEVYFGQVELSVYESRSVTVTVNLTPPPSPSSRPVQIAVNTLNRNGASDADYSLTPRFVRFRPHESTTSLTFTALDDIENDDGEKVVLRFDAVSGITRGGDATVTIRDPASRTVSIRAIADRVDEGGPAIFELRRNGDTTDSLRVGLDLEFHEKMFAPGTATSQAVTIAPGESTVRWSLPSIDDRTNEGNGQVTATVAGSTDYRVSGTSSAASVIIRDDDIPTLTLTVDRTEVFEGEVFTQTNARSGFAGTELIYLNRNRTVHRAIPPTSDFVYESPQNIASVLRAGHRESELDWSFAPHLVSPLGSTYERWLVPFDEELAPFAPQYVLGDPHSIRVEISDSRPAITIKAKGGTSSVAEGELVEFELQRVNNRGLAASRALAVVVEVTREGPYFTGTTGRRTVVMPATTSTSTEESTASTLVLSFPTHDDETYAPDGYLKLHILDPPSGAMNDATTLRSYAVSREPVDGVRVDEASVTITNDDLRPALVVEDVVVREAVGEAPAPIVLSRPASEAITMSWRTIPNPDGDAVTPAVAGTDYTASSGALTFAPGEVSKTVTVPILDNDIPGVDKSFFIELHGFGGPLTTSDTRLRVLIQEDDVHPVLSMDPVSGREDSGTLDFTLKLNRPHSQEVTARYSVVFPAAGEAASAADFESLPAAMATATIQPGATEFPISLTLVDDALDEFDETFTVRLESPVNAVLDTTPLLVNGAIVDNDPEPTLTVSAAPIREDAGLLRFALSLDAASGREIEMSYETVEAGDTQDEYRGSASPGEDYGVGRGRLSFSPGETEKFIAIAVAADQVHEADETVVLRVFDVSHARLATGSDVVTGVIADDDLPVVSIAAGGTNGLDEGDEFSFQVSRVSLLLSAPLDVVVRLADDGNYLTVDDQECTVRIPATQSVSTTSSTIGADCVLRIAQDDTDEPDGTVTATIVPSENDAYAIGTGEASYAIRDDDPPPILGIDSPEAAESDGALGFEVTLSAASDYPVSVSYATADGTAEAPADYAAASGTLTFEPGETSRRVPVSLVSDGEDEAAAETLTMTLSNPMHATLPETPTGTGAIRDSDLPVVTIMPASPSETEGALATFRVNRAGYLGDPLTVILDLTQTGIFVAAAASTLGVRRVTILADTADATYAVLTADDSTDELDGSLTAKIQENDAYSVGDPGTATMSLFDNDDPPGLSIGDSRGTEGGGEVEFTVTLDAASDKTVTVEYSVAESSAKLGDDFRDAEGTLTFPPGSTSQSFRVTVENDRTDEPEETFSAHLANAMNANLADDTADGVIEDDDDPPTVSVLGNIQNEGEAAMVFAVSLSAASGKTVTVGYRTADVTALAGSDYAAADGTLTFAPGAESQDVEVGILDDELDEESETFAVELHAAMNATLRTARGVGTIVDDDGEPSLSVADATAAERDGEIVFRVLLSPVSGRTVTVDWTALANTALAGSDYAANSAGTLTFTPGEDGKEIRIALVDDEQQETEESFYLELRNESNAALSTARGTGTIADADLPRVTIAASATGIAEFDEVLFTVTRVNHRAIPLTVRLEISQDGDFLAGGEPEQVSFEADQSAVTFEVGTVGDLFDEPDGSITAAVVAGAADYLPGEPASVTVAVRDDDLATITLAFEVSSGFEVAEDAGSLAVALVATTADDVRPERDIVFTVSTAADTASAEDFARLSEVVRIRIGDFTPAAGGTHYTARATENVQGDALAIPILDDIVDEENETFRIKAERLPGSFNVAPPADRTVTIVDDDEPPGAPTDFSATPGDRRATLSWTAPDPGSEPIAAYQFRQSDDGGNEWGTWTGIGLDTTHSVDGLENGASYVFQVRARNAVGAGDPATATAVLTIPMVAEVSFGSLPATGQNGAYKLGDAIAVEAQFSEPVNVTGFPTLDLKIGAATRQAVYSGGQGTATLTFEYVVAAGDEDSDGAGIAANGLKLPGPSDRIVKKDGAQAANLEHAAKADRSGHKVDGVVPVFQAARVDGDRLVLTFDEALNPSSEPAATVFTLGFAGGGNAPTVSTVEVSSATVALTLSRPVVAGDVLTVSYRVPTGAGAAPLRDLAGNPAAAFSGEPVTNDTATIPAVLEVSFVSTPAAGQNGTYKLGDVIEVRAVFSEAVEVTGSPTVELRIGTATRQAAYSGGGGTATLTFEYTVLAADLDADGAGIEANGLKLPSGGAIGKSGSTTVNAALDHAGTADQSAHKVDGVVPVLRSAAVDGDRLVLTFDEALNPSSEPAATAFTLGFTGGGTAPTIFAVEVSGATVTLTLARAVAAGDDLTLAYRVPAAAALRDLAGNPAAAFSGVSVRNDTATVPAVSAVSFASEPAAGQNGTYKLGDVIQVEAQFSEAVDVTGTPTVELRIGAATKQAAYSGGGGTATLTFEYTVLAADLDADGAGIEANGLKLPSGGAIGKSGSTTVNAALDHAGKANQAAQRVDGGAPVFQTATVDGNRMVLSFDEALEGSSEPAASAFTLGFTGGGTAPTIFAVEVSGATVTLTLARAVAAADVLTLAYGVPAAAPLRDLAGNPATALTAQPVDNLTPVLVTIMPKGGTASVAEGRAAEFTLTRAEPHTDALAVNVSVTQTGEVIKNDGSYAAPTRVPFPAGEGTATLTVETQADALDEQNGVITAEVTAGTGYTPGDPGSADVTVADDDELPGKPVISSAAPGNAQVTLTWTAPTQTGTSPVTGYDYRYKADGDAAFGGWTEAGADATATVDGLANGTEYTFEVRAKSAAGDGPASDPIAATPTEASATVPSVSDVSFASTPAAGQNDTYKLGNLIQVEAQFSEAVDVTGTPTVDLKIGAATKQAAYSGGGGTATLTFAYTVAAGDADSDGAGIEANGLTLPSGGTIKKSGGATVDAVLDHAAKADQSAHKVDGAVPVFQAATVDGDRLVLTFDEALNPSSEPAATAFTLGFTGGGTAPTIFAVEVSGATVTLTLARAVAAGDDLTLAYRVPAVAALRDLAGNPAAALSGVSVRNDTATVPAVSTASFASEPAAGQNGTYKLGDAIEVEAQFSEPVDVTGTPTVDLKIGAATKQAAYTGGGGTATLTFAYTVAARDADSDGAGMEANGLKLPSDSAIRKSGSTTVDAVLAHSAKADQSAHKVDGIVPSLIVLSIAEGSGAGIGEDRIYTAGDPILFVTLFSEDVVVEGNPSIEFMLGGQARQAPHHGTVKVFDVLDGQEFRYTVVADDLDTDGVSVAANPMRPNGGRIRDAAGNGAVLDHKGFADDAGHKVYGVRVTTAVVLPDGPVGGPFDATIAFSHDVTGFAKGDITVGNGTVTAFAATTAREYVATITPAASGEVSVSVAADVAHYAANAGNGNRASATETVTADLRPAPTVSIDDATGSEAVSPLSFKVSLSAASGFEVSVGYETSDGTATAGEDYTATQGTLAIPAGETSRTIEVPILQDEKYEFEGTWRVEDEVFQVTLTSARHAVLGRAQATGTIEDDEAGQVALTIVVHAWDTNEDGSVDPGPFDVLFAFHQPGCEVCGVAVDGFSLDDITVTSGAKGSALRTSYEGAAYTLEITPASGAAEVVLSVAAGVATVKAGEAMKEGIGNKAVTLSVPVLTSAPAREALTVEITGPEGPVRERFEARFAFNREVTGFTWEDVEVGHGAVSDETLARVDGATYTAGIEPEAGFDGTVTVAVPAESARDGDGAGNLASKPLRIAADLVAPTVTVTSEVEAPVSEEFAVVVTFSEPVSGLRMSELAIGNGHAARMLTFEGAREHTVHVVPQPGAGGEVTVAVPAGVAADAAGNPNAASAPLRVAVAAGPALSAQILPGGASSYASASHRGPGDRAQAVVTFNLAVAPIATFSPSIEVSGGAVVGAGPLDETAEPNDWVFFIAPGGGGDITFDLAASRPCAEGGICTAGGAVLSAVSGGPQVISGPAVAAVPAAATGASVTSSPGADGSYGAGEEIAAAVRFSAPVTVDLSGGTPTVGLALGGAARRAAYAGGSGTAALGFVYTVTEDDPVGGRARIVANSLRLNGATVRDGRGNDAALVFETPPAVTGISIATSPGEDGVYGAGEAVAATLRFSKQMTVDTAGGTPALGLALGGAARRAAYESGSGTRALRFAYAVTDGDGAVRAIEVVADSLSRGGGTIRDGDGRDADLAHPGASWSASAPPEAPAALPALSIADARAQEGARAAIGFTVALAPAGTESVTVDYATADGTARAGEDYLAASGTLVFAPGETGKTVAVAVLDDAVDEGEETFMLRLSNASGAVLADAEGVGTIVNSDPVPKAWLARFGRAAAGHVVDAVGERLGGGTSSGAQLTIAGQRLPLVPVAAGSAAPARAGRASPGWAPMGQPGMGRPRAPSSRAVTARELVTGSAFLLSLGANDNGTAAAPGVRWTAWGRGAASRFDADADGLALDGEVTTLVLGADAAWARWQGGVALAHSAGEGAFRDHPPPGGGHEDRGAGRLASTLTGVHPYLRLEASERLMLWAVLGYGTGGLTLTGEGSADGIETDIESGMAAAGARGVLVAATESGGLELAARTDVLLTRTRSEAAETTAGRLAAAEADTGRLRLVLEGSHGFELASGRVLTPALELGLRHDGGDAETGTGIEAGAGVRYADRSRGLVMEAKVRGLIAHEDSDYREWGASGALRIDPGASGRGLGLTLAPAFGADSGGVERLWSAGGGRGLAANEDFDPAARLDAELVYGFGAFGGHGAVTPFAGLALTGDGRREWRTGTRFRLGSIDGEFRGSLQESASGAPDYRIGIEFRMPLGGGGPVFGRQRTTAAPGDAAVDAAPLSWGGDDRVRTPPTTDGDGPPLLPPPVPRDVAAASSAPRPETLREPADSPRYLVQLGAFSGNANAVGAAADLAGELADLLGGGGDRLRVDSSKGDGLSRVVTARAFAGRREAAALCAVIEAHGKDCYVTRSWKVPDARSLAGR